MLINRFALNSTDGEDYNRLYKRKAYSFVADKITKQLPYRVATIFPDQGRQPLFALPSGLETVDGYSSIYPNRYHRFWKRVIQGSMDRSADVREYFSSWGQRVYLFGNKLGVPTDIDSVESLIDLDLLSLANVRFLFSSHLVPTTRLALVFEDTQFTDTLYVYENPTPLDRAFLVFQAIPFETTGALLDSLIYTPVSEIKSKVFVESDQWNDELTILNQSFGEENKHSEKSTVSIQRLLSDEVIIDVQANQPAALILSNTWTVYWKAELDDGSSLKVFPAYSTFLGVVVPAGQHVVRYYYDR